MSNGFNIDVVGEYVLELNEQGPPGVPGLSIESVTALSYDEETGTYTYRITYNDGSHFDFEIQSGKTYTFSTGLTNTDDTITVDFSEVATAAQGTKADTAIQPSDLQSALADKLDVDPDGVNDLITNNKINLIYVPDILLGQMLYAGTFVPTTAVATLTTNAKTKLGTSDTTITLTNDTTDITGYESNEGNFYLASADGTFADIDFLVGDWLVSTGSGWKKIDNTDAVTGVKGNAESVYRIGNVNITADDVLPTQTSNNGKYLKTNGTTCSWEDAGALPSQTGNNGKFLTTNGTDTSWGNLPVMVGSDGDNAGASGLVPAPGIIDNWGLLCGDGTYKVISTGLYLDGDSLKVDPNIVDYSKYIKNNGTGRNSIGLLGVAPAESSIGILGYSDSPLAISIGSGSASMSIDGVAVGGNSSVSRHCPHGIAIGYEAHASATNAIQIGEGENSTTNTLAIGFGKDNNNNDLEYTLLDGTTGLIPDARLSSNIARTSAIPDTTNMQTTTNLVTSVSNTSTDTQYPSAKCVYDLVGDIETLLQGV